MADQPNNEAAQMTVDERKEMERGRQQTQELIKQIGQPIGAEMLVNDLLADDETRVTMDVPKTFVLTLGGGQVDDQGKQRPQRRIRFPAGLVSVPLKSMGEPVAEHFYVKAHHCKIMQAPRVIAPLGSEGLPDSFEIGGEKVPQSAIATAAQASSGLSVSAWNELPEEERDAVMTDVIKVRESAAERAKGKTAATKK